MQRAFGLLALVVLFTACHQSARPPRQPSVQQPDAAALAHFESLPSASSASAPPEPKFDREFAWPDEPDSEKSACSFQVRENFSYNGRLYFKGRPYASRRAFGDIDGGNLVVNEGTLFASGSLYTRSAHLFAEVHLPELPLFATGPIVRGEFLHIQSTRIATRTSVKGAFFSPDIQLPSYLKLKAPMREDYRIPCAYVDVNSPAEPVSTFVGEYTALSAPDKIVGLSLTPDGPAVAEIVHPENLMVGVLGMYKTTALVTVPATSQWSNVTLVGWIHDGNLDDMGGSIGHGSALSRGPRQHLTQMDCKSASIFVTVDRKLYRLVDVRDPMTFRGALAENGDFRVDLEAVETWSAFAPAARDPDAPLDPFIPKEFLEQCRAR